MKCGNCGETEVKTGVEYCVACLQQMIDEQQEPVDDENTKYVLERINSHPRRQEMIDKGTQARFFGVPADSLSRDGLLMLIGWIGEEMGRTEKVLGAAADIFGNISIRRDWGD